MHFIIFKMIATSDFLTALECAKFVFGRGPGPDPQGRKLTAPPDHVSVIRGPTSKGRAGKAKEWGSAGRNREGQVKGKKGVEEERERERKGS